MTFHSGPVPRGALVVEISDAVAQSDCSNCRDVGKERCSDNCVRPLSEWTTVRLSTGRGLSSFTSYRPKHFSAFHGRSLPNIMPAPSIQLVHSPITLFVYILRRESNNRIEISERAHCESKSISWINVR